MKRICLISLLAIIIDQVIKFLVCDIRTLLVIKDFFSLTYVKNYGAAFSILSGGRYLLISIAVIAIILIYFFLIRNKYLKKIEIISYGILLGGIIGNLIDRIRLGYVVDYLDFNIFGYSYPIFNFADICIVIGAFLLVISTFKEDKDADNSKK